MQVSNLNIIQNKILIQSIIGPKIYNIYNIEHIQIILLILKIISEIVF